ncbi:MAG: hypothetical protein KKI02_06315 [Planctomycetes bacterium]|nr:hypothetical protein [Planctomycetota bacterium]
MAARKKRPVLYEVFRPESPSGDPTLKPRPFRSTRLPERPAITDEREDDVVRTTTISPSATRSPVRERRVLTVSASTFTILIAGMIVLLFVAFAAGRRYESIYPSSFTPAEFTLETDDEAEAQTSLVAATDSSAAERTPAAGAEEAAPRADRRMPDPASAAPSQVTLQRGRNYVVVQHFNKSRQRADALAAAEFLEANGVPCATLTGADIRLIATQPFLTRQADAAAARTEQERASRLLDRIKQLGQRYNRELLNQGKKGYTFSECYLHWIR